MINDAQAHAEDDKKRKDAVDTKNRAESMVFQLEKQLEEHKDKLPDNITGPIRDDIAKLKSAIEANDTDRMNKVMKEMESNMQAMGQEIYKNAQAQQQAGGAAGGQAPPPGSNGGGNAKHDDDVIDADFTDTTDNK